MTDLAGAIANIPPDNYLRVGTVTSVNPLVIDVAGGSVEQAGRVLQVGVGDQVACLRQGQSWLVLGRISGAEAPQGGGTDEAPLALLNGWVYWGGGFKVPAYRRDANGYVHLTGLIKNGTVGSEIVLARLPAGFRPGAQLIFVTATNSATFAARVDVHPGGDIRLNGGGNAGYLSLDGITFLAEN